MPFSEEKSIDQSLDDTEIRTTVNYWNHILESKCRTRAYSTGCNGPVTTRVLLDGDIEPVPEFNSFEGAETSVEENPGPDEVNSSAKVIQVIKTEGAQTFAGFHTVNNYEPVFDLNMCSNKVCMLVRAPTNGPATIHVQLEDGIPFGEEKIVPNLLAEVVLSGSANTWTEVCFDFEKTDVTEYRRLVIFPDFGVDGKGETWYFDNVRLVSQAK
jgi:hypothetical protein